MSPEVPFEIWWAAIPWGPSEYERPVIFLGHRASDQLAVLRLSTKLPLMTDDNFLVERTHPDFAATQLADTSFVDTEKMFLAPKRFRKKLGHLSRALKSDFEAWMNSGVLKDPD